MNRAAFLDRDGVVNEAIVKGGRARSPRTDDEMVLAPDAVESVARLHEAGFLVIVVTNQPEVARGMLAAIAVDAMHATLMERVGIDAVYCCPHDNADDCACRKPRPGMLLDAAATHGLDLSACWLVGDRWVDMAAAEAAGVAPVLLEQPYSWEPTSAGAPPRDLIPTRRASTLTGCVDLILA